MDQKMSQRLKLSHLLIESNNMGLLLKYVVEMNYKVEIKFSQEVLLNDEGPFFFNQLQRARDMEAYERNNGRIRCTFEQTCKRYIPGSFFGSKATWKDCTIALTNIGVFLYDHPEFATTSPDIIWIHELSANLSQTKLQGHSYIFEFHKNGSLRW